MKRVVAIIQARMGSTRLPGKVLMPLGNRTVLEQVIHQLSFSRRIDEVVLATTLEPSDEGLVDVAERRGIPIYRGSAADVLDRYYQAASRQSASVVVRITADCPLLDPMIVDETIGEYFRGAFDYVSNFSPPSFPDGLDAEVFSFAALDRAWREAVLPSEREHVTPYIRNHPELFRVGSYRQEVDLSALRWTLDNPEDYQLLSKLIAGLGAKVEGAVHLADVMEVLTGHPELSTLNSHIARNEGMKKSLEEDRRVHAKH